MIVDELLDEFLYGNFPSFIRKDDGVFVRLREDGKWIPVVDWKKGRYEMSPDVIKKLALFFFTSGMSFGAKSR